MDGSTPDEDPPPFARPPRNLAPLGYRNFALYWLGFATTNTGKNMELVGAVWLVSILSGSPFLLGLIGLARALPVLLLAPLAGVVVDRLDQRRLLFTTQGLALLASFALGCLVLTGQVQVWQVYVEVAAQSAVGCFDNAGRQALFPRLVPRALLPEAVTLSLSAARSAALIGPALGGLAIGALGPAAPFLLNAATFPALMGAVVLMRRIGAVPARVASTFRRELLEGLRHISDTPVLAALMLLEIAADLFAINDVIVTIIGREVLGVGPEALGGLLSADAVGSILGVVVLLTLGQPARQGRFTLLCSLAYVAGLLGFAFSHVYLISFVALALTGLMDVLMTVTRNTIMQLAAPAHMRGRIMANVRMVTGGIGPLADMQSGLLAGLVGGPLALAAAGGALALAAGGIARGMPALWRFSRESA